MSLETKRTEREVKLEAAIAAALFALRENRTAEANNILSAAIEVDDDLIP